MKIFDIIKKNTKLYMVMGVIILLGIIGVTVAITMNDFNAIAINTTSSTIEANVTYDEGANTAEVINNGNMLPISDELVNIDANDSRILKVKFNVSGATSNPNDTIYDIAMYFDELDCELRTSDLKWRLYKNSELLNEGSLSPTYDTINNGRLVLTDTQEDLTSAEDKYTFLLWISEACTGNITQCDSSMDQSMYLNKTLSGSIKIELSTKSKKKIERITGEEGSCDYTEVSVPVCNRLTYNATSQKLVENSDNYTIINNNGVNAGNYNVTLDLKEGYKWNDGSTDNKVISCPIEKYDFTVTTLNQSINYGESISNNFNNIEASQLISEHMIHSISLSTDKYDVGVGNISLNNIKIVDIYNNDVTSNYNIKKKNVGQVTINCLNIATLPTVRDFEYDGTEKVGVVGGNFIEVSGTKNATFMGTYNVTVKPIKNYCFEDGSINSKDYTWNITKELLIVTLNNKEVAYTGGSHSIDKPTVVSKDGVSFDDIGINYEYYEDDYCGSETMARKPVAVGTYGVIAYTDELDNYAVSKSNCATLKIVGATPNLTVEPSSLNVYYHLSDTFTYTYDGDGEISCRTLNNKIATCEVDTENNIVTVNGVNLGDTSIILEASDGASYNAVSVEVPVTVDYKEYIITLEEKEATTSGTTTLYGRYADGVYLDSSYTQKMTSTTNAIVVPDKTGNVFEGYSLGETKLINAKGYVTSALVISPYSEDTTIYADWHSYTVNINYNVNGGVVTPSTKAGTYSWSSDGDGTIYLNDNILTTKIDYGQVNKTSGILNYNNASYLEITWTGMAAYSEAEWICLAGECKGKTYNQKEIYHASDFCDATNSSCTVELGVNWRDIRNHVYIKYKPGTGGEITEENEAGTWGTSSDGFITLNGEEYITAIPYGQSLSSEGVLNYNNSEFLDIFRPGYTPVENEEWKCSKGCPKVLKFDQNEVYSSDNFCDASEKDCTVTLTVNWKVNKVYIYYSPNGGVMTEATANDKYLWTLDDQNRIYRNGEILSNSINYGKTFPASGSGLYNYNTLTSLYITREGATTNEGEEWTCIDGCTGDLDVYDQNYIHAASDFCDATYGDCSVILGVNWVAASYDVTFDYENNIYNPDTSTWILHDGTKINNSYSYNGTTGVEVYGGSELFRGLMIPLNSDKKKNTNYELSVYAYRTIDFDGALRVYATSFDDSSNVYSYNHNISIANDNLSLNTWNKYSYQFNSGDYGYWAHIYIDYNTANQGPVYLSDIRLDEYTTESKTYGSSYGTLPTPTRSGYTFGGWYTEPNGGGTRINSGTMMNTAQAHTLYANWIVNGYTVESHHFYKYQNDEWVKFQSLKDNVTYGSSFTPYNITPPSGYHAGNNYNYYDSNYTLLGADATVGSDSFVVNQHMYAHVYYYPDEYTVSYNANGGSGAPGNQTKYYGTTLTLASTVPTRSGYKFLGWSTSSTATSATYQPGSSFTGNYSMTLYAVWSLSDTTPPTCTLSASSSGIFFGSYSSDVASYGMSTSSSATYNGTSSLGLSAGTKYGFVKDAAGNTGSCSLTIGTTSLGCSATSASTTCSNAGYIYASNNCSTSTLYKGTTYTCTRTGNGNCYCNNNGAIIQLAGSFSNAAVCSTGCIGRGYLYHSIGYDYKHVVAATFSNLDSRYCTTWNVSNCDANYFATYTTEQMDTYRKRDCTPYTSYSGSVTCYTVS